MLLEDGYITWDHIHTWTPPTSRPKPKGITLWTSEGHWEEESKSEF